MAAPCQTSSAEKAWTCRSGSASFTAAQISRYVSPGEGGVDAALEADLDRAAVPGLARAAHDLLERHDVRLPAQVRGQLALREGAEAAAEVADVRVVDVPRDDVADLVAADLAAQLVGGGEHRAEVGAARLEEGGDGVLVQLGPGPHLGERAPRPAPTTARPPVARSRGRRPPARPPPSAPPGRARRRRRAAGSPRPRAGRPSGPGRPRTPGRSGAAARARSRAPRWPRAAARSPATAPPG